MRSLFRQRILTTFQWPHPDGTGNIPIAEFDRKEDESEIAYVIYERSPVL